MKTLHILNGDSTWSKFKDSSLTGDVIVWREVLSEGPLDATLPYPQFFELRSKWIAAAFNAQNADYQQKVITEFEKIRLADSYEEIVLWFEFDLHCQINLLFLLDYFWKNPTKATLSLICPSAHPNHPDFRGIGQLTPEELAGLFPSRILLKPETLAFASNVWEAYCSQQTDILKNFLDKDFGQLTLLKPALQAHLDRIPTDRSAPSVFDQKLIEIVNNHSQNRLEIYNEFWKTSAICGMGDAEIDLYLDRLAKQKLIPIIDPI